MTNATQNAAPRALIVGGSMAGLFTALLLQKRGWRIDVFERSTDELASRGAGIATHPEMMVALDKAGVGSAGLGVELDGRVTFDATGAVIGKHDMPQVTTSWDMLYLRLMSGLSPNAYHTGVRGQVRPRYTPVHYFQVATQPIHVDGWFGRG